MIRSLFSVLLGVLLCLAKPSFGLSVQSRTQSWNELSSVELQSGPPPLQWGDSWFWLQTYSLETGVLGDTPDFAQESFRSLRSFHLLQRRMGGWRVSVGLPLRWSAAEGVALFGAEAFSQAWIFNFRKDSEVGVPGWSFAYGLFIPDRHRPWFVLPNVTAYFLSSSRDQEAVLGFPISLYRQSFNKDWSWAAVWRFQVDRILRISRDDESDSTLNYNLRFFTLKAQLQKRWGKSFFTSLQAGMSFTAEEQVLDRNWVLLRERKLGTGYHLGLALEYSFSGRAPRVN